MSVDRYKLIYFHDICEWELYDLKKIRRRSTTSTPMRHMLRGLKS